VNQRSDEGFSLVEVIMAMFLLMLLALAVLPLFISATRMSVDNRDSVRATALADAHISALRAQFPAQPVVDTTCAGLVTAAGRLVDSNPATLPNIAVPAGLSRQVLVESCPTGAAVGKAGAILVTVKIADAAGQILATLRTRIPVSSA
jgi:type II secretory pathway pseudopilin PulG